MCSVSVYVIIQQSSSDYSHSKNLLILLTKRTQSNQLHSICAGAMPNTLLHEQLVGLISFDNV